ncbi:ABC transporter [Alteribacter lacisalsi]|jgi:ABC-2 type transport system ATP-binding protein|uniref:ABC transporter n=1 Tax=Alteribacter lacisalsi TaxID=2045244 RepID=A0A2W0H6I2_9BACI|nr:ABC transporter ATP-binding protein [Alteribacter lacisalsi]PYZ97474.1 ABC transporter [Alteribacter lacisalsi]
MKICADNVSMQFKTHNALTNVSFQLESGKTYGLIGRNGAGKTTLLSLLASCRIPDEGLITIDGQDPFENTKVMSRVALVFETDYSDSHEPVTDYFDFAERYRPYFDRAYAEDLAARFKLPLDRPVHKFSKGMQSALNVTLGLASRSPVTIFDEAYSGMDAPTREIFYKEVVEEQSRHPRTIILSTHLVSEMDYLFDEVLILHHGRLILHDSQENLVSKSAVITGSAGIVDRFTTGMKVFGTEQLGGTKAVKVMGQLTHDQLAQAEDHGLDVSSVTLQDLFISITEEENVHAER